MVHFCSFFFIVAVSSWDVVDVGALVAEVTRRSLPKQPSQSKWRSNTGAKAHDSSLPTPRWFGNTKPASGNRLADIKSSKVCNFLFKTPDGKQSKVFRKKRNESLQHVLVKAILWKLGSEMYDEVLVEHDIGEKYLPDCVALDPLTQTPRFWGESGRMRVEKAADIMEQHPQADLMHLRWASVDMDQFSMQVKRLLSQRESVRERGTKAEFGALPNDVWRYFDDDGTIRIERHDIEWIEL